MNSKSDIFNKIIDLHKKLHEIGKSNLDLDFFLDKGGQYAPKSKVDEALAQLGKNMVERKRFTNKLNELLTNVKVNKKPVYDDWIQINVDTCNLIINNYGKNIEKSSINSTRIFVAEEFKNEWIKLVETDVVFIVPNVFYLSDYFYWFDKALNIYLQENKDDKPVQ